MNLFFWNHIILQSTSVFNDTFIRIGLILIITRIFNLEALTPVAGLLLMLPIVLGGYYTGCLATKYNISNLVRWAKILELISIIFFSISFFNHDLYFGFASVLLAGIHAAIYSPIKYSIVYYIYHGDKKLVSRGIAIVEFSTFLLLAIGSSFSTLILDYSFLCFSVAYLFCIFGIVSSFFYPKYGEQKADTPLYFFDLTILQHISAENFRYIYNIGWAWFFMTSLTTTFGTLVPFLFNTDNYLLTILNATGSLGLITGSLCLILFLKQTYSKMQSIVILVISALALINMIYILFIYSTPAEMLTLEQLLDNWMIISFTLSSFILSMTISVYITPLYGDVIHNIKDKTYLNRGLGFLAAVTSIPVLGAFVFNTICVILVPYYVLYILLLVSLIVEIIINCRVSSNHLS